MNDRRAAGSPLVLSFVGAGRAASALAVAVRDAGYAVAAVTSRRGASAQRLAELVGAQAVPTVVAAVSAADIAIVAVPDGAVPGVAATVAAGGVAMGRRALVHTAARLGPESLAAARHAGAATGVLHPLQALAGPRSAELLRGSYFRVDASGPRLRSHLITLVAALGGALLELPGEALNAYHAAAVLAGNAPLALLASAEWVLGQAGVEPETAHAALAALLHGAATNAARSAPGEALTGPVARGDAAAIAAHLDALRDEPEVRELYRALARETARLAGREPVSLGVEARRRVA